MDAAGRYHQPSLGDQLRRIPLRYCEVSGIQPANRPWYRALNAYKMAVICLIGSMLYADGTSTDERFMLNASGIPLLTQLGLSELGITEKLDDGPVLPG